MKYQDWRLMSKGNKIEIARSSAAEYLSFVAASGGNVSVDAIYSDEHVWLSQKMMGLLYDVETHTVNYHLKRIFADSELEEDSVIRNFRITAADSVKTLPERISKSDFDAIVAKLNPSATHKGITGELDNE